ncbi:MAG: hypothetical protein JXB26_11275 [Candidatus Aminicenantes bacterium]|nr:hypothetical protein [Candidatus Aminicenantes bacterium]
MFGLITTLDVEYCISFLDQGRVCVFGRDDIGVQYTYLKDGRWTEPQKLPFDTAIEEWKHNTGPDDRTLYFMSPRPVGTNDTFNDMNIYKMEWTGSGWTEPAILPFLPTPRNFMKSIHPFHPMDRPISTAGHSEISRI